MLVLLLIIVVIAVGASVLGLVVHGLFWLFVIGLIVLIVDVIFMFVKKVFGAGRKIGSGR